MIDLANPIRPSGIQDDTEKRPKTPKKNVKKLGLTIADWMKAVCEPDGAVGQECDQPGDGDCNLGIRDCPGI